MQQLEEWPIDRLIDYARNPRKNDHAVDTVAGAIREFGFKVPIVAKSDGTVVDGHLRLKAAKKLKLKTVPVLLADDLTDAQVRAFRLSVNKLAELAEWDTEMLANELSDLHADEFDMALLGFDADELAKLLAMEIQPEETSVEEVSKDAPEMTWVMIGIPTVRFGDINELVERIALVEECVVEISVK
jgi:ParB-like chromosome segregation protein Spo0J